MISSHESSDSVKQLRDICFAGIIFGMKVAKHDLVIPFPQEDALDDSNTMTFTTLLSAQ